MAKFKYGQKVNRIEIAERPLPDEPLVLDRIRQRLAVKVEYEMRHIPESERELQIDRLMPVVEALVASAEGRRDLAAVCAAGGAGGGGSAHAPGGEGVAARGSAANTAVEASRPRQRTAAATCSST